MITSTSKVSIAFVLAMALGATLAGCGDGPADNRIAIQSITVFGDSLSDVGTYRVATGDPANPGKFTVNPGAIWVDDVAAAYGLVVTPNRSLTLDNEASGGATTQVGTATVLGGNGYAEGGARVSRLPSESTIGNNQLVSPVTQQVARYLAEHGSFPSNGLVLMDGGGNDTYAQFSALCWGTDDNGIGPGNTTLDIATAAISTAANDEVALIKGILNHGARLVLVASAGDWSMNPFGRQYLSSAYQRTGCQVPVPASQISAWTARFNQIVSDGVAGLQGVIYLDTSATLGAMLANPSAYGFVNVTDPACNNTTPTNASVFCTNATLATPDAARTYLWSDTFHPTPHGHQILANKALTLLATYAKKAE